jgi:hypothetical protein
MGPFASGWKVIAEQARFIDTYARRARVTYLDLR